MWCFYYAKAKNGGSEIEVFNIWRERNPDMRPTLDSKKLASQRRYILSSRKFTAEQLADIQRNAEYVLRSNYPQDEHVEPSVITENDGPLEGSSLPPSSNLVRR